ncbi:MAG: class II fumarate hydratase [Deltaproteobacteria bacterium]|nr:class II fumarate hydratase [Deltaproteobacteria bacterium]
MKSRTESDSMGEVKIPAEMLYGASTQRAVVNFPFSGRRFTRPFIQALGLIKWAAALTNQELGTLDPKLAKAIADCAAEVARGKHDQHFPIDIFQTGSGTSTNMNANEVIANLANLKLGGKIGSKKPVHPNDHVNRGQSSNDVIPTAIHVAAALEIQNRLIPGLKILEQALNKKAGEFKNIIKIGRTHLMDATPITLGQEFGGYAEQISKAQLRCHQALVGLAELAIGGTAVGTGLNTHPAFAKKVCAYLSRETKIEFREAKNHFEAQSAKDACLFASGSLKTIAVSLMKIANDLRWMGSGPRCGFGEIELPSLQPGSSIMPGKINPVIPEAITQIAAQVIGNDAAVTIGVQSGNFELNVMMPLIASNLLESIELLANGAKVFVQKCIQGIKANKGHCEEIVEQSLAMVTALAPVIGYDQAARAAKEAHRTGQTIREVVKSKKLLDEKKLDKLLNPRNMLGPRTRD